MCLVAAWSLTGGLPAAEPDPAPPTGRLTVTFAGITCEYSPGQEELARELAGHLAKYQAELATARPVRSPEWGPLSTRDLRGNRLMYLQRIAAMLGLERPTAMQEECYDAFLGNYERNVQAWEYVRTAMGALQRTKRLTLWTRAELVRRLEGGEVIAGFSYDPVTKQGGVNFGSSWVSEGEKLNALQEERQQLSRDYRLNIERQDGLATYRGRVGPPENTAVPAPIRSAEPGANPTEALPVVVPAEISTLPPAEAAARLWNGSGERSLVAMLEALARELDALPAHDPQIAYLTLHETTEVGIMDHYFPGPDRRWFCDGVANYVPWRIVRDLHGEEVARRIYDLPAQLAQYEELRARVNLKEWPAVESQPEEEQQSMENRARYAFAAHAVFLMNARAGEDVLPRLFAEIGKTKPAKVSMQTVEKAWTKVTRTRLDAILADAVKPPPATTKDQ